MNTLFKYVIGVGHLICLAKEYILRIPSMS